MSRLIIFKFILFCVCFVSHIIIIIIIILILIVFQSSSLNGANGAIDLPRRLLLRGGQYVWDGPTATPTGNDASFPSW